MTRRTFLTAVASSPLLLGVSSACETQFIEEHHTLAEESIRGYRSIPSALAGNVRNNWIIAPGIREITPGTCSHLMQRVRSGSWLLLESGLCYSPQPQVQEQLKIIKQGLGLSILNPVHADAYIQYSWPLPALVRNFEAFTPVVCESHEVIARFNGSPICIKRRIGQGGIIYFGSMLGPCLRAEDRESRAIFRALM